MTKRKKNKARKVKNSEHSRTSIVSVPKRTVRLLFLCVMLCVVIGVFYYLWTSVKPEKESIKAELPVDSKQQPLPESTTSSVAPEEEFTKLKQEEMELAQQVLKDFPNNDDSYVLMGDLQARHGDSTEAIRFWEKGLELNPKDFGTWQNMGRIALEKEQLDKAVKFLRKALELRSNAPDLRSDIAKALMDMGEYTEAIKELQQEIEIFPSSFTAHFQLAEAYRQIKEYDKAIEHYEQTIKLKPDHSHAFYGLAMVNAKMGQKEKAQEHLAEFRKLRDEVSSIYRKRQIDSREYLLSLRESVVKTYLDAEYLYRDNGNIKKAEMLLNRASELDPNNTRCLERLGALYYATKRSAKAIGCFEKIVRIDPNNSISYLNIGRIATRLKMFEKAEQAFRKVVMLSPNDPVGYCELAHFYLRTNTNLAQAYSLTQKAITFQQDAETYFLLGWAADVNGDRASSLQAMEQAINLAPDNQQYRKIYERIRAKK